MKKIKNQLGLVKPDKLPAGATAKSEQKPATRKASNKKQAKKRKAAKLQEKKASKPPKKRKQGGKGRPYQPKPWEAYAPNPGRAGTNCAACIWCGKPTLETSGRGRRNQGHL
jgi:hypothetical protein